MLKQQQRLKEEFEKRVKTVDNEIAGVVSFIMANNGKGSFVGWPYLVARERVAECFRTQTILIYRNPITLDIVSLLIWEVIPFIKAIHIDLFICLDFKSKTIDYFMEAMCKLYPTTDKWRITYNRIIDDEEILVLIENLDRFYQLLRRKIK